jgi:hypothetical protein
MLVVDSFTFFWLQFSLMDKPRGRGRPRKAGALRMDTDLRIPLTAEQKAVIDAATADEVGGKAEWARIILLTAAKRKLAKTKNRMPGLRES